MVYILQEQQMESVAAGESLRPLLKPQQSRELRRWTRIQLLRYLQLKTNHRKKPVKVVL